VYWHYFNFVYWAAPFGAIFLLFELTDAKIFLGLYCLIGYYFSGKMIRLVLLLSPAAAIAAGNFIGMFIQFTVEAYRDEEFDTGARAEQALTEQPHRKPPLAEQKVQKIVADDNYSMGIWEELKQLYAEQVGSRRVIGTLGMCLLAFSIAHFVPHSFAVARHLSEPQIIMKARKTGEILDDFREAYWWLRDNTNADARVMSWWDYGYQINGIANRTTLADGNTWNHEHIALLGLCLISPENVSHSIAKHLADYVLVWTTRYAGLNADDIAKSPHMARIAGSIYPHVLPNDFYLSREGEPSPMMEASLLWRLYGWRFDDKVEPLQYFEEAYTSEHRMVRIYKVLDISRESKAWRERHGPGYPPALQPILNQSTAFRQHRSYF